MEKIDVVIIGAGIAGIASAYYLKKKFPTLTFKIIESRGNVGGTWDQMKFPGVRADNDMYTYGFSFDKWKGSIIGDGQEIKNYLIIRRASSLSFQPYFTDFAVICLTPFKLIASE